MLRWTKVVLLTVLILSIAAIWNIAPVVVFYQKLDASNTIAQSAMRAYRDNGYDRALTYYQDALSVYPTSWWYNLSPLYVLGYYTKGRLAREITLAQHHATMAQIYIYKERTDLARTHLQKALKYNPDYSYAEKLIDEITPAQ